MASHLVAQHQLSSYASPVNGQAGDATVVLGNDNTTVTGYNSHDSDGTIHVQDSTAAVFAATPAGTQGRKWMTNDAGGVYLYYDNGSAWVEVNYLRAATSGVVTVTSTTTPQFIVRYDASNRYEVSVSSAGAVTLNAVGASAGFTFSDAVTLSAALTYGGVTLSNAVTGTGNMVLSASPTLTGTLAAAAATFSSTVGITGALTYGGVALSAAVTGTGNMVLSASPTFTGTVAAAAITASGTVTAKDGSAAAPSVVFSSDTSTGIYRAGSETMGFAAGGAVRATLSTAALTISSGVTLAAQAITGTTLDLTGNLSVAKASTSAVVTIRGGGSASNSAQLAYGHTSTTYWQTGYQIVGSAGEFEIYDTAAARVALKIATGATGMTTLTGGITATTGTFSGAVSGITTLAGSGAVSGFTSWTGTGLIQTTVTTEQMRLRYDASNYIKTVVGATGAATYTSVGTSPGIGFDIGSSIFLTINPQVFTFSGPGVNGLQIFNSALGNANTGNVYISNGTAPSGNPTTGGYLWVESGALKYRGSSGTVTTVANA